MVNKIFLIFSFTLCFACNSKKSIQTQLERKIDSILAKHEQQIVSWTKEEIEPKQNDTWWIGIRKYRVIANDTLSISAVQFNDGEILILSNQLLQDKMNSKK